MMVDFSSLRFRSLRSFCAKRQTPHVALQTRGPVQALGFPNTNGVLCLSVLRHGVQTNIGSFIFWELHNSCSDLTTQKISFKKSSPVRIFMNYYETFNILFISLNKCSYAERVKQAGRGGRGLDLEAKGWGAETGVFYFSRRNAVEGLDRLVTVGMAEDSPFGLLLRRSSSGESFGMESFNQLSQDKNKRRVRSPGILNTIPNRRRRKGGKKIEKMFFSVRRLFCVICTLERVED